MSIFDLDVLFPSLTLTARETADSGFNRHEMKKMLEGSLERIPEKYREPLVLYYFDDMDYKEIADVLRVPVSTVGVRLQRGKTMLRKLIPQ